MDTFIPDADRVSRWLYRYSTIMKTILKSEHIFVGFTLFDIRNISIYALLAKYIANFTNASTSYIETLVAI